MRNYTDITYEAARSSEPLLDGDHRAVLETAHSYIIIDPDELAESPREWDNFGHMICFHRRYSLGDKAEREWEKDSVEFYEWMQSHAKKRDIVWLPLYLYDHSGITMSYSDTYPYNDYWDAGCVGYIYVTLQDIRDNWRVKRVSKKLRLHALDLLKGEVEEYDNYLTGEVFCFQQICKNCGELLDSCAGFYGDDWETNGLLDQLDTEARCDNCIAEEEVAWEHANLEVSGE